MATVASVYEVDPYPRTAESILGLEQPPERKRHDQRTNAPGPGWRPIKGR